MTQRQRWRKCDRQSDLLQHFLRRFKNFILGDRPLLAGFTLTKKPKKKKTLKEPRRGVTKEMAAVAREAVAGC